MSTDRPVPVLEGRGLSRTLVDDGAGRRALFEDLDITIEIGSSTSVVGPSGCGKSSLLEVLGLLRRPDAGQLVVEGHPVAAEAHETKAAADLRARYVGFVFQAPLLVEHQTALQNVITGLRYADAAPSTAWEDMARRALDDVGLGALADRRVVVLSGGERQRVSIARAVAKRPPLLICDEPTASLDRGSAGSVLEVLDELRRRRSTALVLATHDRELAESCETVIDFTQLAGETSEGARREASSP